MAKSILLTEDDPFICDIYSSRLKKEGYNVDIANDSGTALKKIKNNLPDLVFLDIELPKEPKGVPQHEEGWEILKALRDDPVTKDIKVIVISNLNKSDSLDNVAQFGVLKYFLKVETSVDDITHAAKEVLK
jgi:CheY-like chemotaxis protein